MTKRRSKKRKRQQKKIIITITGAVILVSAATAGILLYKKLTAQTREQAIQEYMGYIEKKEYEKMYELLDEGTKETINVYQPVTVEDQIYRGDLKFFAPAATANTNATPYFTYTPRNTIKDSENFFEIIEDLLSNMAELAL